MAEIVWLSIKEDVPAGPGIYWDTTLLEDLTRGEISQRQIIAIPGPYQADVVAELNQRLAEYPKILVIVMSDEASLFPTNGLNHPDMKLFVQYGKLPQHQDVDGFWPIGYPPKARELIKKYGMSAKSLDWFFQGQNTHPSRHACVAALEKLSGGVLIPTPGFSQEIVYEDYISNMCRAKVIPCPMGNVSPDCFRVYEALEAGCIPIVENKVFWTMQFGDVPFPVVEEWDNVGELINHYKDRPDVNNKCSAWWALKKRELKWTLLS